MKRLLLFGAGRSSTALINYILDADTLEGVTLTIADHDLQVVEAKINGRGRGRAVAVDVFKVAERRSLIQDHDLVISLLPAHLHHLVIQDCLAIGRHLCTASYVDDVMQEAHDEAKGKGLHFMGELGLDPGLDHMSALQAIAEIKDGGGVLHSFKSYTGGLVAPESDDHPWHYKVSWNPRNVVLAGQGLSTYRLNHARKFIPYHQLFERSEDVDIEGMGIYDMYVNRDSVRYATIYDLKDIPTIVRGTLRYQGFCAAWHALIQLGYTDTNLALRGEGVLTYRELTASLLPAGEGGIEQRTAAHLDVPVDGEVISKLTYLGIFDETPLPIQQGSLADVLVETIKKKWELKPQDKDMIIMQHEYEYELGGERYQMKSTLIEKGEDSVHTAMSKLVGLPLAMYVDLLVNGRIQEVTAPRPVHPSVYLPILERLEGLGVRFEHVKRQVV